MEAGKLRHRVTIETPNKARDPKSGEVLRDAWVEFATVWAEVKPVGAFRREQAEQTAGKVTHEVSIRWLPNLPADFRLNFGGRVLKLTQPPINVGERNVEYRMTVNETRPGANPS